MTTARDTIVDALDLESFVLCDHCRVAQATGLCRPATRRAERERASNTELRPKHCRTPHTSGRRVANRNGWVARSTQSLFYDLRP